MEDRRNLLTQALLAICMMAASVTLPACAQKPSSHFPSDNDASADSIQKVKQLAEAGNANAQNLLGEWYYFGKHIRRDFNMASYWWQKATDQGHAEATGNLARCYRYGHGVEQDSLQAVRLYETSFAKGNTALLRLHEQAVEERGSIFSAKLLRECYSNGIGVKRDQERAVKYMQILDQAGDQQTTYQLALYHLNNKQPDKAFNIFKRLAALGHGGAYYYCGLLTMQGQGVAQDKESAISYFKKADSLGFASASYQLGKAFMVGDGVPKDEQQAVEHLKRAAKNNGTAKWELAECYRKGTGTAVDYLSAIPLYADVFPAHEKKFPALLRTDDNFALFLQAIRCHVIDGKTDEALALFQQLKKEKVRGADIMEAILLCDEKAPSRNEKKAAKILKKHTKDTPLAAFHLSKLYEQGKGVKSDSEQAIQLLRLSAEGGCTEAQRELANRLMEGKGMAQDFTEAAKWYLEIEANGRLNKNDAKQLAELYDQRISSLPDLDQASNRSKTLKSLNPMDKMQHMLNSVNH